MVMDGRTDLSIFQLRSGQREKNFYDKDMTYVPTKEQKDIKVFRTTEFEIPSADRLLTIQNGNRERDNYFNTDPIWRKVPEYIKQTTPLSNRQAWRIHLAASEDVESELLSENLRLQQQLFNKDPNAMLGQLETNDELLETVKTAQMIENEKIVP